MTVPRPELTGDYDMDPEHSQLGFVARHVMITKVRGSVRKTELSAATSDSGPATDQPESEARQP